ncbi:MAG: hypothetical protein ACYSUF_09010 [Planctomycetota bacterium]
MNSPMDPFQELADLFLTDSDGPPPSDQDGHGDGGASGGPGDTVVRTADVELIVVGSLPVRATLWLVPYADAVGRDVGPTALIRLDEEAATLQVLQAGHDLAEQRWPTLGEAIAGLAGHVARWVVRPALDVTPGDLAAAGCRRVTILSSANEGAIVDAYQRIKSLVEAAEASGASRPSLGLAVLGAERKRAERMQQQLSRTTKTFLEVDLRLAACVQRMGTGPSRRYGRCCAGFGTRRRPPGPGPPHRSKCPPTRSRRPARTASPTSPGPRRSRRTRSGSRRNRALAWSRRSPLPPRSPTRKVCRFRWPRTSTG